MAKSSFESPYPPDPAINENTELLFAGFDYNDSQRLFSTLDDAAPTYVRNATRFGSIDPTPLASRLPTTLITGMGFLPPPSATRTGVVAVAPNFALRPYHVGSNLIGSTVRWVTTAGAVIDVEIAAEQRIGTTDIVVCHFITTLAVSISKVLPPDWRTIIGDLSGDICLVDNRLRDLSPYVVAPHPSLLKIVPCTGSLAPWSVPFDIGDSGHGIYLWHTSPSRKLILLALLFSADVHGSLGPAYGDFIADYVSDINAYMHTIDPDSNLTYADLG